MSFSWEDIPAAVARPLLQGSVGNLHLLDISNKILEATQTVPQDKAMRWLAMSAQVMMSAWEWDILNPNTANYVLKLHEMYPVLDTQALAFARTVGEITPPANVMEFQYVLLKEGHDAALDYLENALRRDSGQLFWLWRGILLGMASGKFAEVERWLSRDKVLPKGVRLGLLGDAAMGKGDFLGASACYLASLREFPSLVWRERLGEASLQNKSLDLALGQWDLVLQKRPWHTNLLLKRYDLKNSNHEGKIFPEGRGAVLLYTWNKASYLEQSLTSLAESDMRDTPIIVLNNGSTDHTKSVIKAFEHKLGERFISVEVPCNIGAPAARNWLLTLPETQNCQWVAFLDDDAVVPDNWLYLFGQAMQTYPDSPVYGCRVVDSDAPHVIQSADLHLEEGGEVGSAEGGNRGKEPLHMQRFTFTNIQNHCFDYGSFSYMRPCVSVTGCCHLLRRKALDAIGHFDVRFSPSQYDDLEHDIRYALQAKWPVYQGHLRVDHARKSGNEASVQDSAIMSAWANLFKLQTKYTHEEYSQIRQLEHDMLLSDIIAKQS